MQLNRITVELRPRSPWEAMELGFALTRRHAAAIWKPWLLLTLPLFAIFNAAGWAIDQVWLAGLVMWWLKPVFDRIPLFVISRAVFGDTPSLRQTLAAQRSWGWGRMLHYLTWRRLGPARSLYLPIDLLEGGDGDNASQRRRTLGAGARGTGALLTLVCVNFEIALTFAAVALVLMFVPLEFLPESARAVWALMFEQPPPWAEVAFNALAWAATTAIEPFYVGAGFGLYLNRRTQIEAWDVELAFRRLRARLSAGALSCALILCLAGAAALAPPAPAQAQETPPVKTKPAAEDATPTLPGVFGDALADDRGFRRAVDRAYRDPLLNPQRKIVTWELRRPSKEKINKIPPPTGLGTVFALIVEYGLWVLLAALVLVGLLTARRWWPWLRGGAAPREPESAVETTARPVPEALPDDVPAAARRLWRDGRPRAALALLYRASVEAMAQRAGISLVPGATEAECLRAARRMPIAEDRDVFARMVRIWQQAAYAQRLPPEGEFETLLSAVSQRFGWAA